MELKLRSELVKLDINNRIRGWRRGKSIGFFTWLSSKLSTPLKLDKHLLLALLPLVLLHFQVLPIIGLDALPLWDGGFIEFFNKTH